MSQREHSVSCTSATSADGDVDYVISLAWRGRTTLQFSTRSSAVAAAAYHLLDISDDPEVECAHWPTQLDPIGDSLVANVERWQRETGNG